VKLLLNLIFKTGAQPHWNQNADLDKKRRLLDLQAIVGKREHSLAQELCLLCKANDGMNLPRCSNHPFNPTNQHPAKPK
jgi:hypothetical protein